MGDLVQFVADARKAWYSVGDKDLLIVPEGSGQPKHGKPLSAYSQVVKLLPSVEQRRIYVRPTDRPSAMSKVAGITGGAM